MFDVFYADALGRQLRNSQVEVCMNRDHADCLLYLIAHHQVQSRSNILYKVITILLSLSLSYIKLPANPQRSLDSSYSTNTKDTPKSPQQPTPKQHPSQHPPFQAQF